MPLWRDRPESWREVFPGVRRRILTHGTGAMLVLYRIAPDSRFPEHVHNQAQHGIVIEGGGKFRVGAASWTLCPGDSYSVPVGAPHELVTDPKIETVILDVFAPDRSDFLAEALPPDAP